MEATAKASSARTISFRFGTRFVRATGARNDREHPNVLRLRVHVSVLQRTIQTLVRWLPSPLRSWAERSFPEWFLPLNIVLKQKKEGWDEEFDTEIATYQKLRGLQGTIIPIYYGQVRFEGKPALILSDIGGACVAEPKGAVLREEDLRPLFRQALSALMSQGISHDDVKLDNFHLVRNSAGRAIMVVDLERVNEIAPEKDREQIVQWDVNSLMRAYRDDLECLQWDGLRLPFEAL
ncbi:hypothetical protein F5144DRAFT_214755 [Chaetomium tenue]|uniref:Uncharacterized protein n=1 Tax=Chaetomium tenue TaxID=1854479 RepID=A0ACB7P7A8_9PEZI|nr:hypothetical protein F5144DRAFT_214755 [Chaetomium globosum]